MKNNNKFLAALSAIVITLASCANTWGPPPVVYGQTAPSYLSGTFYVQEMSVAGNIFGGHATQLDKGYFKTGYHLFSMTFADGAGTLSFHNAVPGSKDDWGRVYTADNGLAFNMQIVDANHVRIVFGPNNFSLRAGNQGVVVNGIEISGIYEVTTQSTIPGQIKIHLVLQGGDGNNYIDLGQLEY